MSASTALEDPSTRSLVQGEGVENHGGGDVESSQLAVRVFLPALCCVLAACGGEQSGGGTGSPPPDPIDTNVAPIISGAPPGRAETGRQYNFVPSASDPDLDALSFKIDNVPVWASFSEQDGTLSGQPGMADVGTYTDIVIRVSDGLAESAIAPFDIVVVDASEPEPPAPSNRAPRISGTPPATATVGEFYTFTPTASDSDGDALSFSVAGAPAWATLSPTTGTLSGTPQASDVGAYPNMVITVSDGALLSSLAPVTITVSAPEEIPPPPDPTNTPPIISGTPPASVQVGAAYVFAPSATDADGDPLTFSAANLPAWMSISRATGVVSGVPRAGDEGLYNGIVIAVSDGMDTATTGAFSIRVDPAPNTAPTISGIPDTTAAVGELYRFTPTAEDEDGDTLTFSIRNPPAWTTFSTVTGELSGTPQAGDEGSFSGIVIAVSDGVEETALPVFGITVDSAPNSAPTIEGVADSQVIAGESYRFAPTTDDPDGDPLTFSIDNAPAWTAFSTSTGELTGTPEEADVGTYADIVISVTDGVDTAALSPFSIEVLAAGAFSVTLNWSPPTQNTDDSELTDLDAYRVYYGAASGNYTEQVEVENPGLSSFMVEGLAEGAYFFAITAVNSVGEESDFSNEVSITLPR